MTDRGDELHDDGHGELVDERDGTAWEVFSAVRRQ